MTRSISIDSQKCCSREKERLVEVLRRCDFCSESRPELHACYREAARESGRRSRECLTS